MSHSVLVLGGSGLLGSAVARFLSEQAGFAVSATLRDPSLIPLVRELVPRAEWYEFDALDKDAGRRLDDLAGRHAWIVNAIGVIKQRISDQDPEQVVRAMRVDSLLPRALHRATASRDTRVLQIATDCVYSGSRGGYTEAAPHDAGDVYGQTKSLGEVLSPQIHHLRCSIVGLEPRSPVSLLGWFLTQPRGACIRGFTNHHWNGLTSLHFAKLVAAIIQGNVVLGHMQHVVPRDVVTKYELLRIFAACFDRPDVDIEPAETTVGVERSLSTERPQKNVDLWRVAGYSPPPSIREMVREFADWPLCRALATRTGAA